MVRFLKMLTHRLSTSTAISAFALVAVGCIVTASISGHT
jgi:hypothetical protein